MRQDPEAPSLPDGPRVGYGTAEVVDLVGEARERAIPAILESFVGIYRWHAKRTLRRISTVRAAQRGGEVLGISMLERLVPEVGYVYYIAVGREHRRQGVAGLLLDDALTLFRREGATIIYGAVEEDNVPSLALFRSRGFRLVERKELGYREGGLGAWGLRSQMMLVHGEVLFGRRLLPAPAALVPTESDPKVRGRP